MPYLPGTIDDLATARRRRRRRDRLTTEAQIPNGSSPYATTDKVKAFEGDLQTIDNKATEALQTAETNSNRIDTLDTRADAAETTLAGQADRIDALADRADAIETGQSTITTELTQVTSRISLLETETGSSTVITTTIDGDAMPAIESEWTTVGTIAIPTVDRMAKALAVVTVNGCLTGGPSALHLRASIDGTVLALSPCPYAGGTRNYPGARIGARQVALTVMTVCDPGAEITVEAMAGNAGDYPSSPDSALYVCARIDYRRELS